MGILNEFELKGKTALVTGCKRGIGKAMAIALAQAGANIIGVSATLEKRGSKVEQAIQQLGRKFTPYTCDFNNRKTLYAFIKTLKIEHPNIDILVNNAGTIKRAPAVEHNDTIWDEVIEINQTAQFILTREIGKDMITKESVPSRFRPAQDRRWRSPSAARWSACAARRPTSPTSWPA